MGRMKGSPKTGGRKAGTPNKVTADLKDWVSCILVDGKQQFEDDLKSLEPKERVKVYTTLLGYMIPKPTLVGIDKETIPHGLTIVVENDADKALIESLSNLN